MFAQTAEKQMIEVGEADQRDTPKVAILLCTFNGAYFLQEQLESIEKQDHGNWQLFASDDGSIDETLRILDGFSSRHSPRVDIREGPRQGSFVANFRSLACDTTIDADYF